MMTEKSAIDSTTWSDSVNRRQLLRTLGAAGTAVTGIAAVGGSAAAWEECDCVCYKLDRTPRKGDTFEAGDATITIQDVKLEDGEVVCVYFDVEDCTRVCEVRVKGGPDTNVYTYREGVDAAWVCSPEHQKSPQRERYEISNVVFCVFEDCRDVTC